MPKYIREPTAKDFLQWAISNKTFFEIFYEDFILPKILELEQEDYFGTEGFDNRFG